ncbi:hypothetical protein [Paludisphaera soli]|uniref:hypothetical protein n=1 Tax=Paludisphaera soli TaxID=2712865 RepID=UPI0013ECC8C9|nr:hypothetical protein [Paludisphaera soli]
MDETDAIFVDLFARLRGELRDDPTIGLALKAQGAEVTLRVRSEVSSGDDRSPFFALVVGAAEHAGAYRISYKPSGTPLAEPRVTIVEAGSVDALLEIVRGYVDVEGRRARDHR